MILLDDRIVNTSWGGVLYDAFPKNIHKKVTGGDELILCLEKHNEKYE